MQTQQITNKCPTSKKIKVERTIDFSKAYKLCLFEKRENPSSHELKAWLGRSGVVISPQNFLETMYKKGIENV